jgi:hypothetical protein
MQEVMGSSPFTSIEKHRENEFLYNSVFQNGKVFGGFLAMTNGVSCFESDDI